MLQAPFVQCSKGENKLLPSHATLTKTWEHDFYNLELLDGGLCDICQTIEDKEAVLGPKGCHHWGKKLDSKELKHGICGYCFPGWLRTSARIIKKEHACQNRKNPQKKEEPHTCRITSEGVHTFLKEHLQRIAKKSYEKVDNKFWDDPKWVKDQFLKLSKLKKKWETIKKFVFLCPKCKRYKKADFLNHLPDFLVVCPGCGHFYVPKNRKSCSTMHCPSCLKKGGVDISICFYCHQSKCGGDIICLGSRAKEAKWKCPRDCLEAFSKKKTTKLPMCSCESIVNAQKDQPKSTALIVLSNLIAVLVAHISKNDKK